MIENAGIDYKELYLQMQSAVVALSKTLEEIQKENKNLKEENEYLKRKLFGTKSETSKSLGFEQLSLFDEAEAEANPDEEQFILEEGKRQIGPILKKRSLCEIIEPQGGRIFMPGTSKVDWMHMFAEQESSELSISQYCKLHGISDKAFYNARSRYKKTVETPSLVTVEVSDDTGFSNTGCISFKLNGMSFEFDESAPDSDIQRIIKICLSL